LVLGAHRSQFEEGLARSPAWTTSNVSVSKIGSIPARGIEDVAVYENDRHIFLLFKAVGFDDLLQSNQVNAQLIYSLVITFVSS
jgi:hypothetical protein